MVVLNRIYTRKGDDGTTALIGGKRCAKHALRIAVTGEVDELNAHLGLIGASVQGPVPPSWMPALRHVQNQLFDLGADLANPAPVDSPESMDGNHSGSAAVLRMTPGTVAWLEGEIDRLNADLQPLRSFVLPGGSLLATHIHIARTIARRAERTLSSMAATPTSINPVAQRYLNRLSDYLFVLARWVNDRGRADVLWVPGATPPPDASTPARTQRQPQPNAD